MKKALLAGCVLAGTVLFSPSAWATTIYIADLDGIQETPSNLSPGRGFLTAVLDDNLDTFDVSVIFDDLLSPTTASHLHKAPPGVAGPIRLPLTGFPFGVTLGSYNHRFFLSTDLIGITPAAFIAALNAGEIYANIHTNLYPGGEIRGQLAVVPEPGSLTLLGIGLVGLVRAARRRRDVRRP